VHRQERRKNHTEVSSRDYTSNRGLALDDRSIACRTTTEQPRTDEGLTVGVDRDWKLQVVWTPVLPSLPTFNTHCRFLVSGAGSLLLMTPGRKGSRESSKFQEDSLRHKQCSFKSNQSPTPQASMLPQPQERCPQSLIEYAINEAMKTYTDAHLSAMNDTNLSEL
jgi:hypothetical protein